jgi:hypothetical protein
MANQAKLKTKQTQSFHAPILVSLDGAEVIRIMNRQGQVSRTEISSITG